MPRIRKDPVYERCERTATNLDYTISKAYLGSDFKSGDIVKCNHGYFNKYDNCKVVGFINRGSCKDLCLVYTTELSKSNEICWGEGVLALEVKYFERI